jgi:glyoxylase-like metal-dependent hydrolase (beta-lactamase superfamily II)
VTQDEDRLLERGPASYSAANRCYGFELSRWTHFKASDWFFRYDAYQMADVPAPMACYVWLIQGSHGNVLVDCGFSRSSAAARGLEFGRDIRTGLAAAGLHPRHVDHVVLSHLHFDHTGNIDLFPNADFSLSRAEFDFWTGPFGRQPALAAPVESLELQQVLALHRAGRLTLFDEELEVAPGVHSYVVGGHTPGQTITKVDLGSSRIVLAGDAAHYEEEFQQDRLFRVFTNARQMLETYALLRDYDEHPDTRVIAGHDPQVMTRFAGVADGWVDLGSPNPS